MNNENRADFNQALAEACARKKKNGNLKNRARKGVSTLENAGTGPSCPINSYLSKRYLTGTNAARECAKLEIEYDD